MTSEANRRRARAYYHRHKYEKYMPKVIILKTLCPHCKLPDIKIESVRELPRRHSDNCIKKLIREEKQAIKEGWLINSSCDA